MEKFNLNLKQLLKTTQGRIVILAISLGIILFIGIIWNLIFYEEIQLSKINEDLLAGQVSSAEEDLISFLRVRQDNSRAWSLYGDIEYVKRDFDTAFDYYNKALELNPNNYFALTGRGRVYSKKEKFDLAISDLEKAVEIKPDHAPAHMALALVYLEQDNYDLAQEYGEKAYKSDEFDPTIAANLSIIYHYNFNIIKRDEMFDRAAKLGYENMDSLRRVYKSIYLDPDKGPIDTTLSELNSQSIEDMKKHLDDQNEVMLKEIQESANN